MAWLCWVPGGVEFSCASGREMGGGGGGASWRSVWHFLFGVMCKQRRCDMRHELLTQRECKKGSAFCDACRTSSDVQVIGRWGASWRSMAYPVWWSESGGYFLLD